MYPIFVGLTWRSEVPVPPGLHAVELKIDESLTDLELFKLHCLPIVDRWDDVPWLILVYIRAVEFSWVSRWCIDSKKPFGFVFNSEVHMWQVLEYFARAKHICIPHGWDAWCHSGLINFQIYGTYVNRNSKKWYSGLIHFHVYGTCKS